MHVQLATDDLGIALAEVTFVVLDLETTGGSPKQAGITEIGAVKVKGGEVLGEFGTLVNPEVSIPLASSRRVCSRGQSSPTAPIILTGEKKLAA